MQELVPARLHGGRVDAEGGTTHLRGYGNTYLTTSRGSLRTKALQRLFNMKDNRSGASASNGVVITAAGAAKKRGEELKLS